MENSFPCICGHSFDFHYDPDADGETTVYGEGKCQAEKPKKPGEHRCSSCGYDPDNYCYCLEFKPNNLLYLEKKADERPLL